jgi:low temperature requirement protein LtrA
MTSTDVSASRGHPSTPTVSWFELFYDLVVVATVALCNDSFLAHPSATTAITSTLAIAALSWVWFMTTLVNNLFPGQDIIRRFLVLGQMAAVVVAALAVDQTAGLSNETGLAAFGIALGIVALLILWAARQLDRRDRVAAVLPLVLAMTISLVGSRLPIDANWPFLVAALAVSIVPILTSEYTHWEARSMLRPDHLRERLGLFVLIILGEGFAQLVHALHDLGTIPRSAVFALTFLLSFALWWIYFDGTYSRHTDPAVVRWRLALLAHFTLVLGMIGTLDILVLLTVHHDEVLGDVMYAYFNGSLALVLLSFAALGFTARGRLGAAGWMQIASGLAILGGTVLILPGPDASLTLVIGGATAVIIANAVVSVWADQAGLSHRWSGSLGQALKGSDEVDLLG